MKPPVTHNDDRVLFFSIPMTPPSVNHYVRHTRTGHRYVTPEAKAYKAAIWAHCREKIRGKAYAIWIFVYLGKGQKGDWDNFPKLVCDGLVDAGVIDSDAKITDGHVYVRRDRNAPRTEIRLRVWREALK